jgi:hypothetical protein
MTLVFLGFAPTFYLRSWFGKIDATGSTGLPGHLIFHGLALTSWYALFCVQAALVSVRKTGVHRKLGVAGAVSALAVITSGVVVLMRVVPRRIQDGVLPPPELLELFREVALGQTFNLTLFAGCVGAAIYYRRRPDVHKRLMLIASVLVLGAALSTNRDFGAALQSVLPGFLPVGRTTDVLLIASLLVFDWVSQRRLLATSIFGAVLILLVRPVWMSLMLHSDLDIRWTNWLGRIPT